MLQVPPPTDCAKLAASLIARATPQHDASGILLDFSVDSDDLVISCSGLVPDRVIYAMEFTTFGLKTKRLFLCDRRSLWYHQGLEGLTRDLPETIELVSQLVRQIKPKRVFSIGTSAGGYLAILLGALLKFDRVLALSPQINTDKAWMESVSDNRWSENFDIIHETTGAAGLYDLRLLIWAAPQTSFRVMYPTEDPIDVAHVREIAGLPNVHLCGVHTPYHNISEQLSLAGQLNFLVDDFVSLDEIDLTFALARRSNLRPPGDVLVKPHYPPRDSSASEIAELSASRRPVGTAFGGLFRRRR